MSINCRIWKRLTNTSTRKYCVQKLQEKNIAPTDIMQVTGHKNVNSINNCSEITLQKQKEMSEILSTTNTKDQNKYSTPENRTPMTNQLGIQQAQSLFAGAIFKHLHLPKCLPGLYSSTSKEIQINNSKLLIPSSKIL